MNTTDKIRILAPASQEKLAQKLKKMIEDYRIPVNVTKKTGIRSLEEAAESWLIVICTPETPSDPEIMTQIETFLDSGKRNQVLTLLAEGDPETSFPESLLFEKKPDGTMIRHEPLAANIVGAGGKPDEKKLKVEQLRLLAPILTVSFDDLMNRSRRRRKRILFAAGAIVLAGAAIFLGFAFSRMRIMMQLNSELQSQYDETELAMREAEEQRDLAREALAETTAMEAGTILEEKDTELALLLCLEYLPEMEHVSSLTDVFNRALETLCDDGFVPVTSEKVYKRTRESELKEAGSIAMTDLDFESGKIEDMLVSDDRDSLIAELPFSAVDFMEHQGIPDKLFVLAEHGIAAFEKEPFRLLYTIKDEHTDMIVTAPNGSTYWNGTMLAALPDGEGRIVVGKRYVYDAKDGTFLYEIEDYGQSGATGILRVSAEGWMPFWLGTDLYIVDLADGHIVQILKSPGGNNHSLYGKKDDTTGQTSALRMLIYSYPDINSAMPRIFWEYHESAIDIPEDLNGKIDLAKKLLGTRELISSERKTYHMDE